MIDIWSAATVAILPHENSLLLSHATGFILCSSARRLYLITNYHVVSGKHPETNLPLGKGSNTPDRLLAVLYFGDNGASHNWKPLVLRTHNANGSPNWFEHPAFGPKFDVVAIPLMLSPAAYPFSIPIGPYPDIDIRPSSQVSAIGFPHGISGSGAFPIWKSGSVASEPDLLIDDNDYFWIDCNSRTGMSGAPVIARRFGAYQSERGNYSIGSGTTDRLLGVYAGRAIDAADVTLGRVWRHRGLHDIIAHADGAFNANRVEEIPTTLGHYAELTVPTIDNTQFIFNQEQLSVAKLLRVVVDNDQRFGMGIDRVRLAAKLIAALDAAEDQKVAIDLNQEWAILLLEAMIQPLGWQMGPLWRLKLSEVEAIITALQNVSVK